QFGNVDSSSIGMSADGRFVVYSSAFGFSATQRILVRDRLLGTIEIASVNDQGQQASGTFARDPRISADGRFVLFSSDATNLVPGDSNFRDDVFVHDRLLGTTERVDIGTDGTQGDMFTFFGALSRDGRYVAFATNSTTLLGPGDTNGKQDIYVRDRLVNFTKRVSVAYNGAQSSSDSGGFSISGDGQTVAFSNADPNLLPPGVDTNGKADLFVRDADPTDPLGVDTLLFHN